MQSEMLEAADLHLYHFVEYELNQASTASDHLFGLVRRMRTSDEVVKPVLALLIINTDPDSSVRERPGCRKRAR